MTVRDRKKQLIGEYLHKDEAAENGRRITAICAVAIAISRIALSLYEIIYFSVSSVSLSFVSYLIVIVGLFAVYMLYDGNNALAYVLCIAGALRILYLFGSIWQQLPQGAARIVYAVISSIVFAAQCVLSVIPPINKKCVAYSNVMQRINLRLQAEIGSMRGGK